MDKFDRSLSVLANFAVVVGMIFLAFELHQNNEVMRSQTRTAVSMAIIDNIAMGVEPRVLDAYLKARRGDDLTEKDRVLLDAAANATFRLWENTYYQHQAGMFDPEEFEADMAVWRNSTHEPGFGAHWHAKRMTYSKGFRDLMDRIFAEADGKNKD